MSSGVFDNQNSRLKEMNLITGFDLQYLLELFAKGAYVADSSNNTANRVLDRCRSLMEVDYNVIKIDNKNGELCPQYPSQIFILEYENASNQNANSSQRVTDTIYETVDFKDIREQILKAKHSRCRQRFPVPTILYKGKYVCRSSTLSTAAEMYSRAGYDYLFLANQNNGGQLAHENSSQNNTKENNGNQNNGNQNNGNQNNGNQNNGDRNSNPDNSFEEIEVPPPEGDESNWFWQLYEKTRDNDVKLLKQLNVTTIVDLMVEKRKLKYGLYVSSSEKIEDDENRYSDFNLISIPYPGCEFFKEFYDNNYTAENLYFDWDRDEFDATLSLPDNPLLRQLRIDWGSYKQWDLITITQNYIKYLLKYLQDNTSGILVHCISGWDRTPLFTSLLRICLWADGLIHKGLNEFQILYLTVAYDWYLFGHNLSNRLKKGEEVFFFCFYILKYLTSDEFSIAYPRFRNKRQSERSNEDCKSDSDPTCDIATDNEMGSNLSLNSLGCGKDWVQIDENNCNPECSEMLVDSTDNNLLSPGSSSVSRTSPINIPGGSNRLRRTDSSTTTCSVHSNNSNNASNGGGWQIVTGTGSLAGSDHGSLDGGDIPFAQASVGTVVEGEERVECLGPNKCRASKLINLRELFYGVYFRSIGSEVKMGALEPSLINMITSVIERVFGTRDDEQ